jgi:hypothetical protein
MVSCNIHYASAYVGTKSIWGQHDVLRKFVNDIFRDLRCHDLTSHETWNV